VLRVKVKGHRDLVTIIGTLATANAGEWIAAQGAWTRDKNHGLQFKAHLLRCSPPSSPEGIEKYLGSGMIKGIGPVYAKKLVAKFGERIFDIIDNYSVRLEEVDGIGPERRRKIKAAWTEQKAIRQIMVFLHSHGVGTSRAVRIYKTYGEAAIERVRANPYALAEDVPGIGFKTADQIAQRVGIPPDSLLRASAGLTHLLLEATSAGHCALPRELLVEQGVKLLGVKDELVTEALRRMLATQQLVWEQIQGRDLIFHPALQRAEMDIAAVLQRLSAQPPNYPPIAIPQAIAWCQAKTGKELAPSQRDALAIALASRLLVITGGPGVGKTTLVNALLRILRTKGVRCLLCAPTGRAAKRLSETTGLAAKTIHRLLEYLPATGAFSRNQDNPLECDLLIVDEVSMVDVPLMHKLLRALPAHGNLVLVGDVDQLPSVGPGMVLRHIIDSGVAPVVRLTEVFRQAAHSRIVTSAHRINQGLMPELPPKDAQSDFYFIEREHPAQIISTLRELVCKRIPAKFQCDPVNDIQVLCPMNRGSLGARELNQVLQADLNPPQADQPLLEQFGWQFRVGDKVIQTENNYDKDVFNGDLGRLEQIDPVEREVVIRFDQREVVYDFSDLDQISPAYAMTIHKAQGSEFPIVVIPLAMQQFLLLQRNLVYTGITRGKRLVMLIGQRKALALAVLNARSEQRFSALLSRLSRSA
jgi:exodeoxyribonuclease V alpha subunit